ncbi:MAG: M15 family metallopeptidase, partial [Patescibacteria group bacterium]
STIEVDLRYATTRNFLGIAFYDDPTCYVTRETAERLKAAEAIVEDAGYRLLIWDCKRPLEVQQKMWNACVRAHNIEHCAGLVANPEVSPSRHTYGKTVDVSLAPLFPAFGGDPMPTAYDSGLYPDDAAEDKTRARPPMPSSTVKPELWSDAQFAHYELLRGAMTAAGFTTIGSEWWHFESD